MARPPQKKPQPEASGATPYRKHKGRLVRLRPKQTECIDLICFRDGVDPTEVANTLVRDSLVRLGLFPPEMMNADWLAIKKRMEEAEGKAK